MLDAVRSSAKSLRLLCSTLPSEVFAESKYYNFTIPWSEQFANRAEDVFTRRARQYWNLNLEEGAQHKGALMHSGVREGSIVRCL